MDEKERLNNLGFTEEVERQANMHPGFYPARVIAQYKDLYKVATAKNELLAEITGRLRYASDDPADYPAVGDFVLLDREEDRDGNAIIHYILNRRSLFLRKAAGTANVIQVVASNIDHVFLCMSLNQDFNLRRLERYLAIAWDSKATPVVVLTKADLCEDLATKLLEIQKVALGVDVLVTSGVLEDGYHEIEKYLAPGKTVAFLGSSGVGKSTLINRLLGEDRIQTKDIRSEDDKGRHATTRRELYLLPSGGAVIDTPGMRELGLESADLSRTFSEIEELASQCRFGDCKHVNEPGCAVLAAIESGTLDQERLHSYQKLQTEAGYEGLDSRQIEKEKMNRMFAEFDGVKNARDFVKSKSKNQGR